MGGGVVIMIRKCYQTTMIKSIDFTEPQCIKVNIISNSLAITIYVIYRPPNSDLTSFLSDYYTYFTNNIIDENTIILGDFNIKMNLNIYESIEFNIIINSLNQEQHITFPTHVGYLKLTLLGNRLDLIITIQNSIIITNLHYISYIPSTILYPTIIQLKLT